MSSENTQPKRFSTTRSAFSKTNRAGQAGYILTSPRESGVLATSGMQGMPLFSKVLGHILFSFSLKHLARYLWKARGRKRSRFDHSRYTQLVVFRRASTVSISHLPKVTFDYFEQLTGIVYHTSNTDDFPNRRAIRGLEGTDTPIDAQLPRYQCPDLTYFSC